MNPQEREGSQAVRMQGTGEGADPAPAVRAFGEAASPARKETAGLPESEPASRHPRGRPRVTLTLIVPLHGPAADPRDPPLMDLLESAAVEARGLVSAFEILVVADAGARQAAVALAQAAASRPEMAFFALANETGESAILRAALRLARGAYVVTLPPQPAVAPGALERVLARLRAGDELVLARRSDRRGPNSVVDRLLERLSSLSLADLDCGVRGMTRSVARELADGGDVARLLPFLAHRNGRTVREVVVEPVPGAARRRGSPRRGLHDLLAVVFLLHFARAPLRLFGSTGALVALVGLAISASAAADKLLRGASLARRPMLVLGVLLIVVGVQTIALGILGEITVFARTRRHREYRVDRVLR